MEIRDSRTNTVPQEDSQTAQWSLSAELCSLSSTSSEAEALFSLGLIGDKADTYRLISDYDWHRGGAETFILRFSVKNLRNATLQEFIVKACVSQDISRSLGETVDEWQRRRQLLSTAGVSTPKLVAFGNGVVIEEYIPFQMRDYFTAEPQRAARAMELLVDYFAVLEQLGFVPIEAASDLRTRGYDLVCIDFGEDLGPPRRHAQTRGYLWDQVLTVGRSWGVLRQDHYPALLYQRFHSMKRLAE